MDRKHYYKAARAEGWPAKQAWSMALTRERWSAAEARGLVRMSVEPDDDFTVEDYDPSCKRQAAALLEREGAWGIVGQARCGFCGEWHTVDSVWGFVGKSWSWSGYDTDVMASALRWLEEHHA